MGAPDGGGPDHGARDTSRAAWGVVIGAALGSIISFALLSAFL
jgi:hypothetical protein